MGWNGSGTFNRSDGTRSGTQVWQDAKDAGVKIRADDHDTHDQDLADGLENTVALDGQTTTTTDNAILRFDSGNSKFEGVTISASQIVGRSAAGDTRGMSAATARQQVLGVPAFATAVGTNNEALFWSSSSSSYDSKSAATARSLIGIGTAAPSNNKILIYSSASSQYVQRFGFPNVDSDVTATDEELNKTDGLTATTAELNKLDGITGSIGTTGNDGPFYSGWVDVSGPTLNNGPSGWTVSKIGTGRYKITHNLGLSDTKKLMPVVTNSFLAAARIVTYAEGGSGTDLNNAEIEIVDTGGSFSDVDFQFGFINMEE